MTVASTTNRKSFSGDAVTTSFGTSPVVFYESTDLVVQVYSSAGVATTLTEGTHYSVSGGSSTGAVGTVNLAGGSSPYGAPAVGTTLLIRRVLPVVQEADFVDNDINDAEVSETALDKLTMIAQQISETSGRGVALPAVETATDALTVLPFDRASKYLAFDANKEMIASDGPAGDNVPVSTFMATVLDDATAADARTTLEVYSEAEVDAELVAALQKTIPQCGRLTLTTGVPVTSSDVTGATTVYFTPYKGNIVTLYDGTDWVPTVFTELSQATSDTTKSPAAVANNSNYDIFVWNDAGTLRATRGPAWSSDTARGTGAGTTELELLEGRYVNKVAITNGPVAQRGLYVGTVRSDGSAQINDSNKKRHVWNSYNRVSRALAHQDSTATWTYTTSTWRQARASADNQVEALAGLAEDMVDIYVGGAAGQSSAPQIVSVGVGVNSTTGNAATISGGNVLNGNATQVYAVYRNYIGVGQNTFAWLEWSAAVGTTTWVGTTANMFSGISGQVFA